MAQLVIRQPIQEVRLNKSFKLSDEHEELVKEEVNVKKVSYFENDQEVLDLKGDPKWKVVSAMGNLQVAINTEITEDLKEEGHMRTLVRQLQDLRKKKGLSTHDRVTLSVASTPAGVGLIGKFERDIKRIVLIDTITFSDTVGGEDIVVDDIKFNISLEKSDKQKVVM